MPAQTAGHVYAALGYPNSQNKKIDHTKKHIATVIWPYAATVLSELNATVIAKSLNIDGEDHIFIRLRSTQRWPASSRQCFAFDKWSLCRLIL